MNKLIIKNISKKFNGYSLFENVNLECQEGHIYGLIGPNGCGKSVLLKILSGLLKPDSGEIYYNDKKLHQDIDILPSVGVVIDSPQFYETLSGFENLYLLASIRNIIGEKEIVEILNTVRLKNDRMPVKKYSVGMKQRLALAQAIMENPEVLLLDEITNGIDKKGVNEIYTLLKNEKESGKIIFLTSHRTQDINELCDVVFEIDGMEVKEIDKEAII